MKKNTSVEVAGTGSNSDVRTFYPSQPQKSNDTRQDFLTVLTTLSDNILATKSFALTSDGIQKTGYGRAAKFTHRVIPVDGIHSLHNALQSLATDTWSFVIRGAVIDPSQPIVKRRKHARDDEPAYITGASHQWLHVDVDGVPLPNGFTDSDVKTDTAAVIQAAIREYLPSYLHNVTFSYQLSSSMLVTTDNELRCHLWFWLEQALTDTQLDNWAQRLKEQNEIQPLDGTVYRCVQPNYVAAPVFIGMVDPCEGFRSGLVELERDVTQIPDSELQPLPNNRPQRSSKRDYHDDNEVIRRFNADIDTFVRLLERHGYKYAGKDGNNETFVSPLSQSGAAGVKLLTTSNPPVVTSFGFNDYLPSEQACDYFETYAILEHNGDKSAAYKAAASELGVWREHEVTSPPTKWERQCYVINRKAHLNPSQFDAVIDVDTRYLTNEWSNIRTQLADAVTAFEAGLDATQQRRGMVVFIDAPVGSAKSTALFNDADISSSDSAAFIAPLVSLCQSISKDTSSADYKKLRTEDYKGYHYSDVHRLTITPNSLPKMRLTQASEGSDKVFTHKHLVLDESDAIVARLSDNDVTNEQSMYEALRTHIAGALLQNGVVYLSSAYHQSSEMVLVRQIVDELAQYGNAVPVILLQNHHKVANGRTFELLEIDADKGVSRQQAMRAAFIRRVLAAKQSKQVAIGSDSEAFLTECYEAVQAAYPEQRHLLITALTKNNPDVRAFLDDEKRDARGYDSIFYDPVLGSGFDIKADHHNHDLFLYYCARSVSPKGAIQLSGRFRDAQHLVIASENYSHSGTRDVESIKGELADSLELDNTHITTTLDGRRVWSNAGFTDVHAHNIAHDRWQRSAWRTHFLALLHGMGFSRMDSMPVQIDEQQAQNYRDIRETVRQHEAVEIADAEPITPQQADAFRKSNDLSRQQQRSLERFEYESYYGHEATSERILEDRLQRRCVSELVLARATDTTLQYMRDSEIAGAIYSDGVATAMSVDKVTRYGVKRELRRRALQAACIDPETLTSTSEYNKTSESVLAFVEWLENHRSALGAVANIPNSDTLADNPLKYLGEVLRGMGIRSESRLVTIESERVRLYSASLDTERMPSLLERLRNRESVLNERVSAWLERTKKAAHTPTFYYRQGEGVNTVQDSDSPQLHTPPVLNIWQAALAYCEIKNEPETRSILASLQRAGARIEVKDSKPRIIWQHCTLPMTHETIKNDFLLPNRETIAAALAAAVSDSPVTRLALQMPYKTTKRYELI